MKMLCVTSRFSAPCGHDEATLDETRRAGTSLSMITPLITMAPAGSEDRPCRQGRFGVSGGCSEEGASVGSRGATVAPSAALLVRSAGGSRGPVPARRRAWAASSSSVAAGLGWPGFGSRIVPVSGRHADGSSAGCLVESRPGSVDLAMRSRHPEIRRACSPVVTIFGSSIREPFPPRVRPTSQKPWQRPDVAWTTDGRSICD